MDSRVQKVSGAARLLVIVLAAGTGCSSHVNEAKQEPPVGSIRGSITLNGTPPRARDIDLSSLSQSDRPSALKTESVVVDKANHVQGAFVFVKAAYDSPKLLGNNPSAAAQPPQTLAFSGYRFKPRVVGLQIGQIVVMQNNDLESHAPHFIAGTDEVNFHLQSAQNNNTSFKTRQLMASVRCQIHPWEYAWVAALPHPFHAVSSADGSYEITGLPAGRYLLEIWHEYYASSEQEVTVTPDKPAELHWTLAKKK